MGAVGLYARKMKMGGALRQENENGGGFALEK